MTLRTQTARGLKWQAIEIIGRQLLSLLVFTSLARLLAPASFGLVGLAGVYLAFVSTFADQGISTALVQRKELEPQHLNAAFWFNMGFAGALCLVTILLAETIAAAFGEPSLAPLLRWSSLVLVINAAVAVQSAVFVREMDFRLPMIRTLAANAAGGAAGIFMALRGYGVWALVGQQLTTSAMGACFLWIASPWRPIVSFSLPHLKQLIGVSSAVFATSLLWFFSSRVDHLVIGRLLGTTVLGQYLVATKLPELFRMAIHQPVAAVSMPALARLQHDHSLMREAIYKGMEYNSLLSFPIFFGLAVVAPEIVVIAFGPNWVETAPILRALSLYQLLNALLVYCHPALLASGGPGKYLLLNVAHSAGAILAVLLGVRWGPEGVAWGLLANGPFAAAPPALFGFPTCPRIGFAAVYHAVPPK